ncbi:cell wall protein [Colletotrichum paranaense]|uniref:Cell wall protein n=3 Tax=Colletotrichum acutatum species complex TaxID=2707335 RepID=A0AAI9U7E6_9PEZI|nr:cell wall protein [Colletotrichum paranaense]XP_060376935.1 cell wall protein [Colletotrichum tamarilloi]KAK1453087.1 cell wall protein [Colletotrichum melonis]KAK1485880.1 cell wall protein [Colletotrichum tamarilloi]KAK1537539.1 cell wall protein [Colletotrichum paranaense]
MKFTTEITLLTLAMGVFAEPPTKVVAERDLATIQGVIQQVGNSLKDLNKAVEGFNGDLSGLAGAAGAFTNTLNQGTQQVMGTSEITLNEALQLQQFVSGLQSDGNALTKNLEKKKPEFEKASLCGIISSQVGSVGDGAKKLIDTVVTKVPQSVQSVASQLAGSFATTLSSTQQSFAAGNCTNANGMGGGGNGTSNNGTPKTSSPAKAGAATLSVGLGSIAAAAFAVMLL